MFLNNSVCGFDPRINNKNTPNSQESLLNITGSFQEWSLYPFIGVQHKPHRTEDLQLMTPIDGHYFITRNQGRILFL